MARQASQEARQRNSFSHAVVHPALLGRISTARIQPYTRKHVPFLLWSCCTTPGTIALGLGYNG